MAKKITSQEVERMAILARLNMTAKEKKMYEGELSSILEYVDSLSRVDTRSVLPYFEASSTRLEPGVDEVHVFADSATMLRGKNFDHNLLVTRAIFTDAAGHDE